MIAIKKILVPIDLSDVSIPAIGYASSLATVHHAEIILFHVIHTESLKEHFAGGYGEGLSFPPETPMKVRHEISVDNIFAIKKQMVLKFLDQKIRPDLRNLVKFTPLVTLGKVAEEIIAAANEDKCDLIVITSRGSRLRRLLGGSITDQVVRSAPCPVLSMQPSAEVRTENDERLQIKFMDQWAA